MRLWATLCTYRLNWARPCCGCHCHPYDSDTKDSKFPILPIYRERKPTGVATGIPARTKHLYTMCTTSAQNLRRWPNIVQMLYKSTFHVAKQRFQPVTWSAQPHNDIPQGVCLPTVLHPVDSRRRANARPPSSTLVQQHWNSALCLLHLV